jgi:Lon protease-like protein
MGQKSHDKQDKEGGETAQKQALNPYAPEDKYLPDTLAVFPLTGALLLPCGQLPLNIFEPRYLAMIDHALSTPHRMIGMMQPRPAQDNDTSQALFDVGCAGKITDFHESTDGRYEITLTGISRYHVKREHDLTAQGFRSIAPSWDTFAGDFEDHGCLGLNRDALKSALGAYFNSIQMECDWDAVDGAPDGRLITCLSMICPFEPTEKQALLETQCCKDRAELFIQMLKMATQLSSAVSSPSTQH